jgi:hypothetical protein
MTTSYLKMGVEATQLHRKTDHNIEDNVSGRITITIVLMGDCSTAAVHNTGLCGAVLQECDEFGGGRETPSSSICYFLRNGNCMPIFDTEPK